MTRRPGATHALVEGCTLVSADHAFAHVPGLRVFDWSASPNTPDKQTIA